MSKATIYRLLERGEFPDRVQTVAPLRRLAHRGRGRMARGKDDARPGRRPTRE
ncbi:MAG: hypothetical protein F4029_06550 [Gammaproteobacteria bacterium]|nr:hypothetical protein [Gammaproteobacteria bacterium]MYK45871.1 hypothetical protein [Gammaproteobacteria bacterium]